MNYFFDRPTQVAFYNIEDGCYDAGIADGDHIIRLSCGGVLPIQDLLDEVEEVAPEVKKPIIELYWSSLREECLGGLMFNSKTGEIITH